MKSDRLARVPIERDPDRVRELAEAEEKRDENVSLRAFLKWGSLSPRLVDRLFHRAFAPSSSERSSGSRRSSGRGASTGASTSSLAEPSRSLAEA